MIGTCEGCGNIRRTLLSFKVDLSSDGQAYMVRHLCRYCGDRLKTDRRAQHQFMPFPALYVAHYGRPRLVPEP